MYKYIYIKNYVYIFCFGTIHGYTQGFFLLFLFLCHTQLCLALTPGSILRPAQGPIRSATD